MKFDLRNRTKSFALKVIKLVKKFPKDIVIYELGKQLIRSGTSIGSNLEEADAAITRKDFFYRTSISYKEAKESRYWLELILDSSLLKDQINIREAEYLRIESIELSKILFSIINQKN